MTDTQQTTTQETTAKVSEAFMDTPVIGLQEIGAAPLSKSRVKTLDEHHAKFAEFQESYVRAYITLADTKAAWVFAIASGVLAYLFSKDETQSALITPECSLSYLVLMAAVVFLVLSAFFAFRVVAPRMKSPSGEGIVFFGAVAEKQNAATYISEVESYDRSAITEARLKHCYDVSCVCADKYASLRNAIWLGLPGLGLSLVHILLK